MFKWLLVVVWLCPLERLFVSLAVRVCRYRVQKRPIESQAGRGCGSRKFRDLRKNQPGAAANQQ